MQALRWLLEEKLGLNAQNRRLHSRGVITECAERDTSLSGDEAWRRKHQPHVEELAERCKIRAGENISRFVERGLLELSKIR